MLKRLLITAAALGAIAVWIIKSDTVPVEYGNSSIYSKADMDSAIAAIRAKFKTFSGCELKRLRYAGDSCMSSENLAWMNQLGENAPYAWCIEFLSDFHTPKDASGAWEPDAEYKNWEWWLARTEDGEWELLSWGY